MTWNEFGWFFLLWFIIFGTIIIGIVLLPIALPVLGLLYLIDYIGYLWTGYTSEELDRIIEEKHRCSVKRFRG